MRYDTAQTLTGEAPPYATLTQRAQSRMNIFAAPFDALAYSGMQINGSFEVSQEKGTTATTVSGQYVCDGWRSTFVLSSGAVSEQTTASSTLPYYGNFLSITVTTACPMAAGDFITPNQLIEGYRIARLGWGKTTAQPITVGFWSNHFTPGIYSVVARNGVRSCAMAYTHNASNVWQYNAVTFPGDTAGTWAADNTIGLVISFCMASGTTGIAPAAATWYGTVYQCAPGQVNGAATTSDVFRITGVVIIPGLEAPSAARSPLIMRPFDQEILLCQRYYEVTTMAAQNTAVGSPYYQGVWRVVKNHAPTITYTADAGTGAVFNPLSAGANAVYGFYIGTAHSTAATFIIRGDARL